MNKEIKKTNEALSDFLEENLIVKSEDCIDPITGMIDQECKLKSKDGLIESTKIINKRVIVEDGRELLREVTFKHE
tara:strand:+ start:604 stop:831 length:228 start_codon:yes stop_codon:yes gene_type:complete